MTEMTSGRRMSDRWSDSRRARQPRTGRSRDLAGDGGRRLVASVRHSARSSNRPGCSWLAGTPRFRGRSSARTWARRT